MLSTFVAALYDIFLIEKKIKLWKYKIKNAEKGGVNNGFYGWILLIF
jgi:hypothetical protein